MKCECWYHRYNVVHTVKDDNAAVYDHSQGTWDAELRGKKVKTFPSDLYQHGMTATELEKEAREKRP